MSIKPRPEITNEFLIDIKNTVERMSKNHHIEILKILKKTNCKTNENKSGTFVNLSYLPISVIDEIYNYISYAKDQEITIQIMECEKETLSKLITK